MNAQRKRAIFENTARNMGDAPDFIKYRRTQNCYLADPAYGKGGADACGLSIDKVKEELQKFAPGGE